MASYLCKQSCERLFIDWCKALDFGALPSDSSQVFQTEQSACIKNRNNELDSFVVVVVCSVVAVMCLELRPLYFFMCCLMWVKNPLVDSEL